MLFALICTDKSGGRALRQATRPDHLAYLERLNADNILKMAGPLLDDGGDPNGSLVVLEAADRDEAARFAADDPYARAGLFEAVEIRPFRWVINNPEA